MRKPEDLDKGIEFFRNNNLDSLFSCTIVEDLFFWQKDEHGRLKSINYDPINRKRRQDNSHQYIENGSFYIFDTKVLRETQAIDLVKELEYV